jgi:hypothetical protein
MSTEFTIGLSIGRFLELTENLDDPAFMDVDVKKDIVRVRKLCNDFIYNPIIDVQDLEKAWDEVQRVKHYL